MAVLTQSQVVADLRHEISCAMRVLKTMKGELGMAQVALEREAITLE